MIVALPPLDPDELLDEPDDDPEEPEEPEEPGELDEEQAARKEAKIPMVVRAKFPMSDDWRHPGNPSPGVYEVEPCPRRPDLPPRTCSASMS